MTKKSLAHDPLTWIYQVADTGRLCPEDEFLPWKEPLTSLVLRCRL